MLQDPVIRHRLKGSEEDPLSLNPNKELPCGDQRKEAQQDSHLGLLGMVEAP